MFFCTQVRLLVCWGPMTMKQGMIFLYLMDLKLKTWRIFSLVGRYTGSLCILRTKDKDCVSCLTVLPCSLTICLCLQIKPECIKPPATAVERLSKAAVSPVSCDFLFSSPDSPLSPCFRVVSEKEELTHLSSFLPSMILDYEINWVWGRLLWKQVSSTVPTRQLPPPFEI